MGDRLNPGLPPGATVGRPPAADFPDVVEGWKGRSGVTYVQVAIGQPLVATVCRPPAADFPDVVESWKGRSGVIYVQVEIGQPLVATVGRPPAADFPDVVEGWNGWWDCLVQRLRIRTLQGIGMVLSSAYGGLSLCCRELEWIVVGMSCSKYFCAQHEPAEGGRLSVAPCKWSAERSDARSAAWGWHPPKTKEPAARRANERCPNLAMSPMKVRCRDSGGGDRPFVD